MATYEERIKATSRMSEDSDFDDKVRYALHYATDAFNALAFDDDLRAKSTMAMNIAYLTLYLEAIQQRFNIPATSVDGWIDAFVRDENRKADGGV